MIFFFQAEDGIRDYKVTGVQTCALPILITEIVQHGRRTRNQIEAHAKIMTVVTPVRRQRGARNSRDRRKQVEMRKHGRSEERRVGKECTSQWLKDEEKIRVRRK